MATNLAGVNLATRIWRFQSIGVTKEWRQTFSTPQSFVAEFGFQSIGVTKEWRPNFAVENLALVKLEFPINRRHQRMATKSYNEGFRFYFSAVSNQ